MELPTPNRDVVRMMVTFLDFPSKVPMQFNRALACTDAMELGVAMLDFEGKVGAGEREV